MGDLNTFQERFIALRTAMVADGIAIGLPFHDNDLRSLLERGKNEGTSFVKVTLPLLGKALDQGLVSGHFMCIAQFALKRNTRLPIFCYGLFSRIFSDDGALRFNADAMTIRFLRQFLLYDSKLITEPSSIMKEKAVQDFSDCMKSIRKVRLDTSNPVLLEARRLLTYALKNLSLDVIDPGHGPGAVAEKLDHSERWDFSSWPIKAERYYSYLNYGVHSLKAIVDRTKHVIMSRETHTRCCLVPKDFKGPRLISAEYSVNQYLQQGQMKAIMQHVVRHPLLSRSIKLRDQTFNQKAAQRAYADGLVTLDLSSASDTVSVPLVWFLFAGNPGVRRRLMATRSDYMIHSHKKIKIAAFAPMGSATCFPIETLVFWAISMASLRLTSPIGRRSNTYTSPFELAESLRIFGDDIIIPERAHDTLVGTLHAVGCKVNKSKTCFQTPFRESCGSEWFNGSDVSIARNRNYYYGASAISDHPVLCDMQRKLFSLYYYNTAALLSGWANKILPTPVVSVFHHVSSQRNIMRLDGQPSYLKSKIQFRRSSISYFESLDFFSRNDLCLDRYPGLLGFDDDYPSHTKIRFNKAYQRLECRLPCFIQETREWLTEGYPRLMARLLGDLNDRIAIRDRKIKMAWSFIPSSYGFHHIKLD